ncbi:hypothetical protein P7K49_004788 [Saguinus oedipus]|uniref:Uncharacterized protein n=1 Tax=Saguinus oedipus TaxID=9490 RepID=A0ABQ9W8H6_SAGOE|nr:hypothetical protein P7K49_004788 [Saguinus oedipus]
MAAILSPSPGEFEMGETERAFAVLPAVSQLLFLGEEYYCQVMKTEEDSLNKRQSQIAGKVYVIVHTGNLGCKPDCSHPPDKGLFGLILYPTAYVMD